MPYYATFAFFEAAVHLNAVAQTLLGALGPALTEISFEHRAQDNTGATSFPGVDGALAFLQPGASEILGFSLASEHSAINFSLSAKNYLIAEFWDFDSEVYELGEPSAMMKAAKRQAALDLHAALLAGCGAFFTYTTSAEDNYAGPDGHYDTADAVQEALQQGQWQAVSPMLARPLYFWLVGLKKATMLAGELAQLLQQHFEIVWEEPQYALYEHRQNRPFFLIQA
jgi:hypothetical protein